MQEVVTEALVLSLEPSGEADLRVQLFTQKQGRVVALARSARKARGKLAAHLQPLSLTTVRLVERKGVQIVDALSNIDDARATGSVGVLQIGLAVASLIEQMTNPGEPDHALWALLSTGRLATRATLKALGFDPLHARCARCRKDRPERFLIKTTEYFCNQCFSFSNRIHQSEPFVVE